MAGELLERFRRTNDPDALAELFELTHDRLLDVAGQVLRFQSLVLDPDDLVSALFVKLFCDGIRPSKAMGNFLAYARVVMRNEALSRRRQIVRARRRSLVFHERQPLPSDPAVVVADQEEAERLGRTGLCLLATVSGAFHAMHIRDRKALLLREQDGHSYGEVAGRLGVSAGQIGMVILRARRKLRNSIVSAMEAVPTLGHLADLVYELTKSCLLEVPGFANRILYERDPRTRPAVVQDILEVKRQNRQLGALAELGCLPLRSAKQDLALDAAQQCLAVLKVLEGTSDRQLLARSLIHVHAEEFETAGSILHSLAQNPQSAEFRYYARVNLAFSCIRMRQLPDALEHAEWSCRAQPLRDLPYRNLSTAAALMGRRHQVAWALRRLKTLHVRQPTANLKAWLGRYGRAYVRLVGLPSSSMRGLPEL